jgi:hypothetical protein
VSESEKSNDEDHNSMTYYRKYGYDIKYKYSTNISHWVFKSKKTTGRGNFIGGFRFGD